MQIMIKRIVLVVVALCVPQMVHAQGTTYISNLGQSSSGSDAVGSDSSLAIVFLTGPNAGGYSLNSVQLAMTVASGNPGSFTASIYSNGDPTTGAIPGSSLDTLTGSANPATAGIYSYTSAANFTFSPGTFYCVVLTAGTPVANGAYGWSLAGAYPDNPPDSWGDAALWHSSNGSSWSFGPYVPNVYPQFAINASAVPEPCISTLFVLGGLVLLWHRRSKKLFHSLPTEC